MKDNASMFERMSQVALDLGAYKAAVISADLVETDASFRELCKSNACGKYGRCWMCPPDIGEIEPLMAKLRDYDSVLVYQTIGELEDSYDIEGMGAAAERHNALAEKLRQACEDLPMTAKLCLSAGGCHLCETCARIENRPCRFPERAIPPLEGYGVNVSRLAAVSGMKYINGQNTVTYFGAVFFRL